VNRNHSKFKFEFNSNKLVFYKAFRILERIFFGQNPLIHLETGLVWPLLFYPCTARLAAQRVACISPIDTLCPHDVEAEFELELETPPGKSPLSLIFNGKDLES
jgi:hypothetical protein